MVKSRSPLKSILRKKYRASSSSSRKTKKVTWSLDALSHSPIEKTGKKKGTRSRRHVTRRKRKNQL